MLIPFRVAYFTFRIRVAKGTIRNIHPKVGRCPGGFLNEITRHSFRGCELDKICGIKNSKCFVRLAQLVTNRCLSTESLLLLV